MLPIPGDTVLQHDAWIALIIAAVAPVAFLEEPLIKYRQHTGQQIGVSIKGHRVRTASQSADLCGKQCALSRRRDSRFQDRFREIDHKCSGVKARRFCKRFRIGFFVWKVSKRCERIKTRPPISKNHGKKCNSISSPKPSGSRPTLCEIFGGLGYRFGLRDLRAAAGVIRLEKEQGLVRSEGRFLFAAARNHRIR